MYGIVAIGRVVIADRVGRERDSVERPACVHDAEVVRVPAPYVAVAHGGGSGQVVHQHAGVIERRAAVRAVRSADDAIRQIEPCDTGAADRVVAVVMQPDPGEGRCQSRVQDNPCSRWGRCGVVGPSHVLNLAARTSGLIGIRTGTAVTRHSQTSGRPG